MSSILNRLQDLAIRWKAKTWIESELLAELDSDALRGVNPLYNAEMQRELFLRDVGLWRGADKRWRLIDQQPPSSRAQAYEFVTTKTDGMVCCFCRLEDHQIELVKYGHQFLHPMCRRAWFQWTRAAMRHQSQPVQVVAPWWETLGINPKTAGKKEINAAYKRAAQQAHPDKPGGSHDQMEFLNRARAEALASAQAQS